MKRRLALICGLLIGSALCSQDLVKDLQLREYRKDLENLDSLRQNGILLDDESELEYYNGYGSKTAEIHRFLVD